MKHSMRRPQGYATILDPGAKTSEQMKEWDTITCAHCQKIVFVGKDEYGFCMPCYKDICTTCVDKGICTPFMQKIEQAEERARRKAQY